MILSGRPPDSFSWQSLHMVEGQLPSSLNVLGVALGQGLADGLSIRTGNRLIVEGHDLVVTGIVRADGALSGHMILMPLPEMQKLFHRSGVVTIFNMRLLVLTDPDRVTPLLKAAGRAFPDLTFTEARAIGAENPMLRIVGAFAWGVSLIALLMGLVGVLNALMMSVTERVRELGILSALGWQPTRVLALIMSEGLVLAWAGSLVGITTGLIVLRVLAVSPRAAGLIEPEITPRLVIEVVVATIMLAGLGSVYPAWRATRLSPVEALKHE